MNTIDDTQFKALPGEPPWDQANRIIIEFIFKALVELHLGQESSHLIGVYIQSFSNLKHSLARLLEARDKLKEAIVW